MAISVNWPTKIIYVPSGDMTLLQANPPIRELNLNDFRLTLRDLEDGVYPTGGMGFVRTHKHNTEVTLAGLVYARIVEIINGYTVEFEDGQYTVNCVGANHNLSDVKVANQVSLIVNNAAGLISNAQIEYASFNGGVTIDVDNGVAGTVFPRGTPQLPVDNLTDALLIASTRGFNKLYINADMTLDSGGDITGFIVQGQAHVITDIVLDPSLVSTGVVIKDARITGELDGGNELVNCDVFDLTYFNGEIQDSGLSGMITLAGGQEAIFVNCYTPDQDNPVTIDMGGSGNDLAMPNYSGTITITNLTSATEEVTIGLAGGQVTIASGVTAGTIIISGIGTVTDNSTGITVVNTDGLINKQVIADAVWDADLTMHQTAGSFGEIMARVLALAGENVKWSGMTFDANNNLTGVTITAYTDNTLTVVRKAWTITATYNSESELTDYEMIEA